MNSSRHEGLSNAILEAISFRRPIVVSDITANKEMDLPEKCYFETGDAHSLARRLDAALDKPDGFIPQHDQFSNWRDVFERTRRIYMNVLPNLPTGGHLRAKRALPGTA